MFETADMSRLTVAAPVGKIEDVLRTCASLGCVHIEEYGNFEDGIGVGKSINTDNSEHISQMIIKARALQAELNATNTGGAKSAVEANKLTISMGDKIDSALALVDQIRDAQSDISNLDERIKALSRVEPLGIPLELMAGFEGLEIYIAETAKASKAHVVFADMMSEIELQTSPGIIAVACKSSDGAAVQIGLSELGAKPIQIPAGEGSPSEMIATAKSKVSELESSIITCEDRLAAWSKSNGRDLVILLEHLEREESIYTAPTLLAVSNQAFVLDGWVPTSDKNTVQKALESKASHVSIEKYEAPHHGHGHDGGEHESTEVPKELVMLSDYLADKNISVFQFFRSMDLDDSGELEFREIESAMKKADIPDMPPLNMAKFLAAIDLNRDGKINLPELDLAIGTIRVGKHHLSEHYDDAEPPIKFENGDISEPFELLVDLVGRPKYGTFDPTLLMTVTFPLFYGMILGDWGYGLVLCALAAYLGTKPFAADPLAKNGLTILRWMGIWCIIWGLIFAEGFGFVWDDTGQLGSSSPFAGIYAWTYSNFHVPGVLADLLGMGGLHIPFHRATVGGGLQEYVILSVYVGVAHIFLGLVIGLATVYKAHGAAAAYFEKGSWLLILTGGTMQARNMVMGYNDLFEIQIWSLLIIIGLVSLIIGLAIFEKFGWVGGIIMGPIETFGLLANTLSYLRIMGVGVAGVKIAEVSITMGWDKIGPAIDSGDVVTVVLGLILFILIQLFAIALGILSPTIHAVRLHFVEWMGKFYDGSGKAFSPLGGRTLHVESES
jgi:vacuolar-type H+-ATPase subunit I/STV1